MKEEENCFRCLRNDREVKLVDAVYGNEIVKICEECSLIENLPVIRKPSSFQLKESEKPFSVYQRLSRMAGLGNKGAEKPKEEHRAVTLDNLRKPKDYSTGFRERQIIAKKSNKPLGLVDNFNWHIQMARRARKISLSQLASLIGEPEITLRFLEQGNLTDDADRVVSKIEQFFKIKLRKSEVEKEQARIESVKQPSRVLSFNKNSMKELTISDLAKMKDARMVAERELAEREYASKVIWKGGEKKSDTGVEGKQGDRDMEIVEDE